ncbi:TPA: ead/Ea22-like family protein [Salmonella enterica subsp. enterica serovar Derby]|uniref:DUF551 domain-containing protein n=1 Tax=Salmonella typhimurium TaxID=90371 RepID=A0A5Y2NR73_SALTM|nr:DUF551 domain-containing protein [Salmonella enterica subsp. enterica serovar Typhimurium]HBL4676724.1 ead/Ea22-like family protein [Salmonella enterica subsp. enterica serovar Derby]
MSEINYQALREAAERAIPAMERLLMLPADDDLLSEQELKDYGVDIDALNAFKFLAGPETVLALLDERERNQQYIKSRDQENEEIALTVGKLRVELEAAKKRIAELKAEPVSQTYKLPVNTPCQDAPAHIWLQTAGVWPEDGELSELTWCSHNQHHDDTLYVRADLVNGNSPVTPDGWISCSERMPDDGQHVIILCDGAFVLYAQYRDGEFFDVVRDGDEFFETQSRNVTHWMPLPEPPQEAK